MLGITTFLKKAITRKNNQNKKGFKLLIKPNKKSIKKQSDKIKEVLKKMKAAPQEAVISKLNPIIAGWTNYFKSVVASKTFTKLDYLMWEKLLVIGKKTTSNEGQKMDCKEILLYHRQ